jgi:type I restriction enzyme S subunit
VSRINDLITDLCPDGVPFRAIGDIATLVRGNGMPKADFTESGVGCIHYGQIYTNYGAWTTETKSFISPEKAAKLAKVDPGDVIVTNTSENIDDVCKAVAWLGSDQIVTGGHATVIKHEQDAKFLSYYFLTPEFFAEKKKRATGTKVIDVSAKQLATIRVPVPPVEVQREIVRVLDLFTALEAELEAELEARRRQYAHYRDELLSFREAGGGLRWMTLDQLLHEPLVNGRSVPDGEGYPVLRLTALHGSVVDVKQQKRGAWDQEAGRRFQIAAGDLLVVRGNGSKDLIARACMVETTEDVAFPDTMIRVRPNLELISQRYLFYIWESRPIRAELRRIAKQTSGVWKVSQDDLARVLLPVPPLAEQARVVEILDGFDALVNDLSVGLPAELRARRQQYEYYRDKLLTFKELAA